MTVLDLVDLLCLKIHASVSPACIPDVGAECQHVRNRPTTNNWPPHRFVCPRIGSSFLVWLPIGFVLFFFVADYSRWFAACKSASTACSKVRPGPEKRWHCSAPAWPGRGGKPVGHTETLFSLIQFLSWCTALYSRRWGFAVFFLLRFGSSFLDLIKSCQVSLDLALLGFGRALSRFMGLGLNVT